MEGNPVYLVVCGVLFCVLVYLVWESRARSKGLLSALYEEQSLKNELSIRERERSEESHYALTQSVSLLKDIVKQFYTGGIIIEGVGYDYKQDLTAIAQVLELTPTNYLSKKIGDFELDISQNDFNGLALLLEKAPKLKNVRYIELIVIVRIMVSQKVELKHAYSMWESSL